MFVLLQHIVVLNYFFSVFQDKNLLFIFCLIKGGKLLGISQTNNPSSSSYGPTNWSRILMFYFMIAIASFFLVISFLGLIYFKIVSTKGIMIYLCVVPVFPIAF